MPDENKTDVAEQISKVSDVLTKVDTKLEEYKDGSVTKDELTEFKASTEAEIEEIKKALAESNRPEAGKVEVVDPYGGIDAMARFASHIKGAGMQGGGQMHDDLKGYKARCEERFAVEKTEYASGQMQTVIDSEGGFLIPTDISNRIMQLSTDEGNLLGRTTNLPISGNSIKVPALSIYDTDVTTIAGGIRPYRDSEAGQMTASQLKFEQVSLSLHKYATYAQVTDEMIADSPISVGPFIEAQMSKALTAMVEKDLIRGEGADQMVGVLNADAKISHTRATASTIQYSDIVRMHARLDKAFRANAVWLYDVSIEPFLFEMGLSIGLGGGPAYVGNEINTSPVDRPLLGKPIIPITWGSDLGTEGDLMLVDLSAYLSISKGAQFAESMHLLFDYNKMAYRLTLRADAQPWLRSAITPASDGNTRSAFVTLS